MIWRTAGTLGPLSQVLITFLNNLKLANMAIIVWFVVHSLDAAVPLG